MSAVNIIMASYMGEAYIKEQIESILRSHYTNWSLSIWDDGSNDLTIPIIMEYVKRFPKKIKLYQNPVNLGVTKNFLHALKILYKDSEKVKEAEGLNKQEQYYMFCDQDDCWLSKKIEKTLEKMKEEERKRGTDTPIVVFTDAIVVDQELKAVRNSYYKSQNLDTKKIDLPHILMENKCIGCTIMLNRAAASYVSTVPDHARFHDWWVALLAASFGRISYLPKKTLKYRQHGTNLVGNDGFGMYVKKRIKSIKQQQEALYLTQQQAAEFLEIYKDCLSKEATEILKNFASLSKMGWFQRRITLFQYGYFKTGFIRNVGLLCII